MDLAIDLANVLISIPMIKGESETETVHIFVDQMTIFICRMRKENLKFQL